jgi:hypothetical protein
MLTLAYVQERDALDKIYHSLSSTESQEGANFVFFDEGNPVGYMRVRVDGAVIVDSVKFLPSVEAGDRLFFIHAMFYKFGLGAPVEIRFKGEHKELEPYGFSICEGYTSAISNQINLHVYCKGHD